MEVARVGDHSRCVADAPGSEENRVIVEDLYYCNNPARQAEVYIPFVGEAAKNNKADMAILDLAHALDLPGRESAP